ncbi:MAG: acyl carrier protein [Planctomycetota bacterium]
MLNERTVRDRVKTLMVDKLGLDGLKPEEIADDASFEWLELDSVDALELVVWLEKDFGIKVANEDLKRETFESVGSLSDVILGYIRAKEG